MFLATFGLLSTATKDQVLWFNHHREWRLFVASRYHGGGFALNLRQLDRVGGLCLGCELLQLLHTAQNDK